MLPTRVLRKLAVVGALCAAAGTGFAAPRTPEVWRQVVHAEGDFQGQRKNTTWIRDCNRDFIDDEIARRFPTGCVDIVVALNEFSGVAVATARLARYGRVVHVSRLVSAVVVRDVPVSSLPGIARRSDVAMVEWAAPLRLVSDISSRSIQAHASKEYYGHSAQDRGFDGSTETIAILDTGVDNLTHDAFIGKFKEGFDAVVFEDINPKDGTDDSCALLPTGNASCPDTDDEPGDGTRDPVDEYEIGHGTSVASIALGAAVAGIGCRQPGGGQAPDCAGIAAGARLVDVRVCLGETCSQPDVLEGLDWLGKNAARLGVRVANLSFTGCLADDGSGAVAQAVDELVSKGVFVVVAAGNASNCDEAPGTNLVGDPASAGMALTVAALADNGTVSRADDDVFNDGLVGPRSGSNPLTVAMLKPDLSAPGVGISGAKLGSPNEYKPGSGTSYAAPAAAGAAAIVLQARPGIDPSSLKQLLRDTADPSLKSPNVPYAASVDPVWDEARGRGELNVWPAIETPPVVDVGFPSCARTSTIPGGPCALAQPSDSPSSSSWNNSTDIRIASLPWTSGTNNTIVAQVGNFGKQAATVRVSFGVAPLSLGAVDLEPLGEQTVTIPAKTTVSVAQPWVPAELEGVTIGVSISFGFDSDFGNNFTLCRFAYAPSTFELRVENPLDVPARMELRAQGGREGWTCRVDTQPFVMDPFDDPARIMRVRFDAPPNAPPGASAACNVELWAAPLSGGDGPRLVGGVTLRTFVPEARRSPSE